MNLTLEQLQILAIFVHRNQPLTLDELANPNGGYTRDKASQIVHQLHENKFLTRSLTPEPHHYKLTDEGPDAYTVDNNRRINTWQTKMHNTLERHRQKEEENGEGESQYNADYSNPQSY